MYKVMSSTNKDSFTFSFPIWKMSSCVVDRKVLSAVVQMGIPGRCGSQGCPHGGPAVQMNSSGFRISLKTCSEVVLRPGLAWRLNETLYEASLA